MTAQPVTRASTSGRWVHCPEAAWLDPIYPKDESDAAREGTAAHEMAELVLTGKFTIDELVNRQASNGVMMVDEMVDHVQEYVDHVQSRGIGYWIEQEIMIENSNVFPGRITGTCDETSFNYNDDFGILYVDDFKYGFRPVEVFENWQMLIYAIGMRYRINKPIKHIVMTIIQPRPYHHEGSIRTWEITVDQLIGYENQLIDAMKAVYASDRKCHAGEWCRDCNHLTDCAAAKSATMNAVDVIMSEIPHTDSPEQVSRLLDILNHASATVKHALSAIESRAEAMIINGQPLPGYAYVPGRGKRKFIDDNTAIVTAKAMGINVVDEKIVTPKEAIRRGLSEDIVNSLSTVPSTAPKLIKRDVSKLADKAFK